MSKSFFIGHVGAGSSPTVDDVLRVGKERIVVEIDKGALDRIHKESPAPKNFQCEDKPDQRPAAGSLSLLHARVALFCKLLSLATGTSAVRRKVLEAVAGQLNTFQELSLPASSTDGEVLAVLADSMHGSSSTQVETAPPQLSRDERKQLCAGRPVSCGILAVGIVQARLLLKCTGLVAALSVEAVQANVTGFEVYSTEAVSSKRPTAAAEEIMAALEGSKMINARKGGVGVVPAISQVPQALGQLQASLEEAHEAVRAELLTPLLPLNKHGEPQLPLSSTLPRCALQLASALLPCASLSLARTDLALRALQLAGEPPALGQLEAPLLQLQQACAELQTELVALSTTMVQSSAVAPETLPSVQIALFTDRCVAFLRECVTLEALYAVLRLRELEAALAPPPATASTSADGTAASSGGAGGAAKVKSKAGKGGAPVFGLGQGTAALRSYLEGSLAGSVGTGSAPSTLPSPGGDIAGYIGDGRSAVAAALNPLGSSLPTMLDELKRALESNAVRRKPKIPKGTKDFLPAEMAVRLLAFGRIEDVFKRHGAVTIDTPVFELRETLTGKYGEDSKLIYDLADQGGEILSLRYDLTVPFARYVALNGIGNIKRYHMGKVYRRDQPQMNRGRFREFCQCDFDIAGKYENMVADAEVLKVLTEILTDLDIGGFVIKLNHRRLLDAMMAIAGVPAQKFRPICSAIDKLDKEPWEDVRREMVEDKGLPGAVADKIGEFVVLKGAPREMLGKMQALADFQSNGDASGALAEMALLFDKLDAMSALQHISFDLSLARGLDYYTGVIYEAVLLATKTDESGKEVSVGSVAAGGRYDGLVGMYSGKDVPAVGVSIGVERVFSIMHGQLQEKAAKANKQIRATQTQVFVGSIGNGHQVERMKICSELWAAGIKAEFGYKANLKMADNLKTVFDDGIPFLVLFGEDELAEGCVNVKDIGADQQLKVSRADLVADLKRRIQEKGDFQIY